MGLNNGNDSRVNEYISRPSELLNNIVEYVAGYSLGQYTLRKIDDFFWIIEKVAQWSVPRNTTEKSNDTKSSSNESNEIGEPNVLVRPLPWILFFPALVMLRVVKGIVNTIAMLLGMETITAHAFVNFIHNKRTKLKTIQSNGMAKALENKNTSIDLRTLIKGIYSNILSVLCFQRLSMEANNCHRQNVEPVIVGSNSEKSDDTEKHNHQNENASENNIEETIKKIKELAAQSSTDDGSDVELTEYEDKPDDDSISSTNEAELDQSMHENEKNSNIAGSVSDNSAYSTPVLESIAPSIKNQIIAEETEDSDVSVKGSSLHHRFTNTIQLLNVESPCNNDSKSKLNSNEEDSSADVLDELIRKSMQNNDVVKNGEEDSEQKPSADDTIQSQEFINKETQATDNESPKVQSTVSPNKVNDFNNSDSHNLSTEILTHEKENNHVSDNLNDVESSSNLSNCLTENQQNTPKQVLGLNSKKHKHHRRKFK